MCPFLLSKADEEEIEGDGSMDLTGAELQADEQDIDMDDEEEEIEVWTELKQKKIDAALLTFIISSLQNVSVVVCLRGLLASHENYVIPECEYIVERILPHMHNACFNELKASIQEASSVCLSIEQWKNIESENIISITAHYLNSEFELKSILLKCCEFYFYDAEESITFFKETCNEWDILGKINGCLYNRNSKYSTNIKEALNLLGWDDYVCAAHKLNLILKKSLELFKPILVKVKKVAVHFLNDSTSMSKLNFYHQTDEDEPQDIMDALTREDITYEMIETFLELEDTIAAVLNENESPLFTDEDWSKLNQLFRLYEPLSEAIKQLGAGNKYVCSSIIIPTINVLQNSLQEMDNSLNFEYVHEEIKCLMEILNKQFDDIESDPNLAMCTLLDPRYKMSKFKDRNAADAAKANLVAEVQNLVNLNSISDSGKTESGEDNEGNVIPEKGLINDSEDILVVAQTETDQYIQADLTDLEPSLWWQNNQEKYPHIAQLFKTKCSIVATSLLSEYLFSEKNGFLVHNRQLLSPDIAKYLVFLKENVKDDNDYFKFMP